MKIFIDTEFTGLHQSTTLISLALVDENDRIFYAEFTDYDPNQIDKWLEANVLNKLFLVEEEGVENERFYYKGDKQYILKKLELWLSVYNTQLTFVYDVGMYDWVLFCELFGGALHLPKAINFIPLEFSTLLYVKNYDPNIKRAILLPNDTLTSIEKYGQPHSAIYDALVLKNLYFMLTS